jgi:hypothetical protein
MTQQFTATASIIPGTTTDLTQSVAWSSSASAVATISNAAGSQGLATVVGVGSTTITAVASGGVTCTAQLTETPATIVSIQVNPANSTIPLHVLVILPSTLQFTATGTYSDGSTRDLSSTVTWISSNPNVAAIGNGSVAQGLATAEGSGTTTITANMPNGSVPPGSTTLTVQ